MTAAKGVKAMAELATAISEAIEKATKAGLSKDQITSVLDLIKSTVEESDDE